CFSPIQKCMINELFSSSLRHCEYVPAKKLQYSEPISHLRLALLLKFDAYSRDCACCNIFAYVQGRELRTPTVWAARSSWLVPSKDRSEGGKRSWCYVRWKFRASFAGSAVAAQSAPCSSSPRPAPFFPQPEIRPRR